MGLFRIWSNNSPHDIAKTDKITSKKVEDSPGLMVFLLFTEYSCKVKGLI